MSLKGKNVSFDDGLLNVELSDGRVLSTPLKLYKELEKSSVKELKKWRFICDNTGIEWESLDFHLSIERLANSKN